MFRQPNLVLLATTSLYGVGSSQYNRIHVPLAELGVKAKPGGFRAEPVLLPAADLKREPEMSLSYTELGMSRGFGSYHFSSASLEHLNNFIPRGGEIRKVNSIFGEGVNPLMYASLRSSRWWRTGRSTWARGARPLPTVASSGA